MKSFPKLRSRVFPSPMARITDAAFRSLCKDNGADLTVTELINAKGLLQNPARIKEQCIKHENEDRFSIQLFGHEPEEMARAAAIQQQINEGATGTNLSDYYVEGKGNTNSLKKCYKYLESIYS